MSNSVIRFMDISSKIRIFRQLNCDEKYTCEKASEFELFAGWEKLLPLAAGHRELSRYRAELERVGLEYPSYPQNERDVFERWRVATSDNRYDLDGYSRVGRPYLEYGEKYIYSLKRSPMPNAFDLGKYVSENAIKCGSLQMLSKAISRELEEGLEPFKSLYIDLDGLEYLRPDPYGAQIVLDKKISGEKLNCKESFVLVAETLIDALVESPYDLCLRLGGGENISCAAALITYIHRRRFPVGDIFIDVTPKSDLNALSTLVDQVYPKARIYPVLAKGRGTLSEGELEALFSDYPVGAFYVDGDFDRHVLENALKGVCNTPSQVDLLMGLLL